LGFDIGFERMFKPAALAVIHEGGQDTGSLAAVWVSLNSTETARGKVVPTSGPPRAAARQGLNKVIFEFNR